MLRVFGQPTQTGVGFRPVMSKVDTDQGLGPGSEDRRRELGASKDDEAPSAKPKVDRDAITQPGVGKVDRKKELVDELLDGFGPNRPDLPRILPSVDTTPPPEEPVRKELTPTSPGKRRRFRNIVLAMVGTFVLIVAFGIGIVKLSATQAAPSAPPPVKPTTTAMTNEAIPTAQTTSETPTVPPITTMQVDALPTTKRLRSWSNPPTTTTTTPPTTTTTTTARPTGSAPPGMNLLPDDPHR